MDELQESDMIVVLMGSVYDRILEAADLYDEGYSDRIVLINSYIVAKDIIINRGIKVYGNTLILPLTGVGSPFFFKNDKFCARHQSCHKCKL